MLSSKLFPILKKYFLHVNWNKKATKQKKQKQKQRIKFDHWKVIILFLYNSKKH